MPHIHELIDYTNGFYIVFDGEVLLVNHPRYDKWISPGGHIELDEDPDQALMREIEEETGLEVEIIADKPTFNDAGTKNLYTPSYMDIHEANPPHRHCNFIYFAKAKNGEFVKSDEHTELRWFSDEDLDDPKYKLTDGTKFYASEAIKRVSARK